MSTTDSLKARYAALSNGLNPAPVPTDPYILTSQLNQKLNTKANTGVNTDITALNALTLASVTGVNPKVVNFVASPGVTYQSSIDIQATSMYENQMEFPVSINFKANKGSAQADLTDGTSYKGAKVALFAAIDVFPGAGQCYAMNLLAQFRAGVGYKAMLGAEININNNNMHMGDLDGAVAGGLFTTPAYYLYLTGGGSYRMTAAIGIDLATADSTNASSFGMKLNRGIVIFNGRVAKSSIEDACNAREGYLMSGTKDLAGIDLRLAAITTNIAHALASSHTISWRNTANTADLKLLGKDNINNLLLGGGTNSTRINPATNSNILVRNFINFFAGASITSTNDAQNALSNLELLTNGLFINSPLYLSSTAAAGGNPVLVAYGANDSGGAGRRLVTVPNA